MQYHEQQDNLSPEERKRFDALPRHRMPPPYVEEKIMTELQEQGLLKQTPTSSLGWVSRIAAAIVLLVLGGAGGYFWGTSRTASTDEASHAPRYVLLIRDEAKTSLSEAEIVKEYGEWAMGVYKSGRYISGEKLRDTGRILATVDGALNVTEGVSHANQKPLGGYFIIEAKDYDEAVQVASQCPHLKYGGTIELREIEPT